METDGLISDDVKVGDKVIDIEMTRLSGNKVYPTIIDRDEDTILCDHKDHPQWYPHRFWGFEIGKKWRHSPDIQIPFYPSEPLIFI